MVDVTVTFPVSYKLMFEDSQALQSCQSGTLVWSFHPHVAAASETCSQKKMINNRVQTHVEETEMFQFFLKTEYENIEELLLFYCYSIFMRVL